MPKKQVVAVWELKSLLITRLKAEQRRQARVEARIHQEFGCPIEEKEPKTNELNDKFVAWIADVLARRLKRNRRTTPLLSSRDFAKFVPSLIDEVANGSEIEAEQREALKVFTQSLFEAVLGLVHAMIPPRADPYEEYWRWVRTACDLASERGVLPAEVFVLEGTVDEITRRMFSKKQYLALAKRTATKFMNADALKKMVLLPMLSMVTEEEERRELERSLEADLMPQLRKIIKKAKAITNTLVVEEAERIYAA